MGRRSSTEWAKVVAKWRRSGLTARDFASKTGLNRSTLSYWGWKLATTDGATRRERNGTSQSPARRRSVEARSDAGGRSLQLVELPASMTPGSPSALELVLRGEVIVRVPVGFDEDTLTRVVRAVEAAR
jgi:transposase